MDFPTSVLITGVTGCVGSTLARRLADRGVRTSGLVRRPSTSANTTGRANELRSARLAGLHGVSLLPYHFASSSELRDLIDQAQPDVIVHLAAAGISPRDRSISNLLSANVDFTVQLLQAAEAANRPYIVQIGSCFEYADMGEADLSEFTPTHPFSLYGATKSAAVHLAIGLAIELQLRLVVLRLFGVYGPSEAPERFIPTVIRTLASGQALALTPGTQRRDLMHVEDVARAIETAMQSFDQLDNLGIYNICTGVETTIRQVGEMIAQQMRCPASLLEWGALPARAGEPERIIGDGSRFRQATRWQPQYDLPSGLEHTIAALTSHSAPMRRAA